MTYWTYRTYRNASFCASSLILWWTSWIRLLNCSMVIPTWGYWQTGASQTNPIPMNIPQVCGSPTKFDSLRVWHVWGKGPDWVVPAANSKRKVQSILIYRLPGLCLLSSSSLISCHTHSTNATSLGLRLHHPGSVCKFCDSLLLQLPLDPSCLHQVSLWFFQKVRVQFLRQHAVGYMSSNICQSSVTRCAMRAALFYVSGVKTTWNLWISSLWINESS